MAKLYKNAQSKLSWMKRFPFFSKLTNVTILYKFSDNMITSDALMFSYDLALIETPIDAYWRQGISLRPILIYFYHRQPWWLQFRHQIQDFFGCFESIIISWRRCVLDVEIDEEFLVIHPVYKHFLSNLLIGYELIFSGPTVIG